VVCWKMKKNWKIPLFLVSFENNGNKKCLKAPPTCLVPVDSLDPSILDRKVSSAGLNWLCSFHTCIPWLFYLELVCWDFYGMMLLLPSFLIGIVLVLYQVEWQDSCWWSPPPDTVCITIAQHNLTQEVRLSSVVLPRPNDEHTAVGKVLCNLRQHAVWCASECLFDKFCCHYQVKTHFIYISENAARCQVMVYLNVLDMLILDGDDFCTRLNRLCSI
jgi:hypothetical protein